MDVVGQYVKLQKAGVNFRASCPFHLEKKPSFFVSPVRQMWHCFGCGAGGGIFDFVMRIEGLEFGDALRILAKKAGVELKREDPRVRSERQRLYEICELATKFFEKQLQGSKRGQEAKEYLSGRGVSEESMRKWRIGYAPVQRTALLDFLANRGYRREEIVKAGLAIKKDGGDLEEVSESPYFDRFRGRIMFPICDAQEQVVGFSGRVFGVEETAKYINTPGTLLYDKSRLLYGLDKAKFFIRKNDFCILVEGQMDAIMVSQAGYENVVATSGTALTPHQLKILKRYSENILTAFDMDIAGDTATKRGIDLAQQEGFQVKVLVMPRGRDPADIIAENPRIFEDLLSKARSIMDFYFENTFSRFDAASPEGKIKIGRILLPVLKRIPNAIELAHWRQRLARELGISEQDVETELKKTPAVRGDLPEVSSPEVSSGEELTPFYPVPQKTRKEILEEAIAALIFKNPEKIQLIEEKYLALFSPPIRFFLGELRQKQEMPRILFATEQHPRLQHIVLLAESQEEAEGEDQEEELAVLLSEFLMLERKQRLEELALAIRDAEARKEEERVRDLMNQFRVLAEGFEIFPPSR